MMQNSYDERELDRFILENIDSVPHLEALLLLWTTKPRLWSAEELKKRLYLEIPVVSAILEDLERRELLAAVPGSPKQFQYHAEERDQLIAALDQAYRRDLIRISTMIHRKAPQAVLEFARAFRFTKER